jgi:pyruvate dehydrogenase E1 component
MSNDEYQHLLRVPTSELRQAVAGEGPQREKIARLLGDLDDAAVSGAIRNLGGHDLGDLLGAFAEADRVTDRPSVVLAYTI